MNIIANLHCRMMTNVVEHSFGEFSDIKKLNRHLIKMRGIDMKSKKWRM